MVDDIDFRPVTKVPASHCIKIKHEEFKKQKRKKRKTERKEPLPAKMVAGMKDSERLRI